MRAISKKSSKFGLPRSVSRNLANAPFPDHAHYDETTLRRLARRAEDFGAGLVTTEKDWARLPASWRPRVAAWPVRAEFDDPAALDALLAKAGL